MGANSSVPYPDIREYKCVGYKPRSYGEETNPSQADSSCVARDEWTISGPRNHLHFLVVDDEAPIRDLIQEAINEAGYSCRMASNGEEALRVLETTAVDVVITDIVMPGLNGFDLTKIVKERYQSDVIMMTGLPESYTYETIIGQGASDFIQKPMSTEELIIRLKRVLRERAVLAERNAAVEELRISLERLRGTLMETVQAMALTVETRDPYTAGHQKRVANLACAIAKEMTLPERRLEGLFMAGLIHDLGKVSVPAEILSKPGSLTELEFGIIKAHSQAGYNVLRTITFPWPVAQIVLQHHERLDGSGYPQGLSGDGIMMEAKILAVADVVEAMASHRPSVWTKRWGRSLTIALYCTILRPQVLA